MKGYAHGDFETRSAANLPKTGVDVYAHHPTTDAWCFAWAIEENDVQLWTPDEPGDIKELFDYLKHHTFIAHNANFELAIWNTVMPRYGWPELDPAKTEDTMAMCYALALPASLDAAAKAVKLDVEKDAEGHSLMMRMARPRRVEADGTIIWWDVPERMERLYAYCKQDVEVERQLHTRLLKLRPSEQKLWRLDHKINTAGIPIDLDSVEHAIQLEKKVKEEHQNRLVKVTRNAVASANQIDKLLTWLSNRLNERLDSLAKDAVAELLERPDLPADVREVLQLRQVLSKSSIKKLNAMRERCGPGGRARHAHQYHGATTGRFSGRGIQTQNMIRPKLRQDQIETAFTVFENIEPEYHDVALDAVLGDPLDVLPNLMRGFIAAPKGQTLLTADYSNIEGRVLAWLAGQEDKLEAFKAYDRGEGPDLYIVTASNILSKNIEDVTPDERQSPGKVAELAFGYAGGKGAWKNFKPTGDTDEEIDSFKDAWREKNNKIVDFWYALEKASLLAVRKPDKATTVGNISFKISGSFLFCQLPSGRLLAYPFPELVSKEMPWGGTKTVLSFFGQDTYTRKWGRQDTYGGKLAENVTQAVARDILTDAMLRLDDAGYEIVMHVHDEIVSLEDESADLKTYEEIMAELPDWAGGLPIAVAGWKGRRYRK